MAHLVAMDQEGAAAEATGGRVGRIIKSLRAKKDMSLQDLSRLSGVSVGMLSQIERNLANPSLKTLTKIQVALGASSADLFAIQPPTQQSLSDPDFVRRKDMRPLCELGYLTKELLSTGATQALEMMLLHVPPHGSSGATPLTSPAEKGGMILEGELIVSVEGREAKLLAGDSFIFDGRKPHAFRNTSSHTAIVFWVISNFPIDRHI